MIAKWFAYSSDGKVIGFRSDVPSEDYVANDYVEFENGSLRGFGPNLSFWESETGAEVDLTHAYSYNEGTNELTDLGLIPERPGRPE